MTIEHIDELGSMLTETGPDLKKIEPEFWSQKIDTACIWAQYVTLKFINYIQDKWIFQEKGVCKKWTRLWWTDKRKFQMRENTALYKFQRQAFFQVLFYSQ